MKQFVSSPTFKWIIFLFGLGLSFWMFTTFQLHYDQEQILGKVHKLLTTGEWTHYGNRSTGLGYNPGTLLTLLAGAPMALWYSPYSAMGLIVFTQALACAFFYFPLSRVFGNLSATFFLLLFWLSPWRIEQVELYNPSYLFIFSGLHFYSAFKLSKKKSFFWSAVHVLNMGLCAQVHFSVLILGVTSLVLWAFKMVRVHWWGVISGLLLTLLSLLPYFLSLAAQQSETMAVDSSSGFFPGKNLIYIYPVIKAALYWLRYGSFYFARHIFTTVHFAWIDNESLRTIVDLSFHILKWPIGIATLFISGLFQWKFLKMILEMKPFRREPDRKQLSEKNWMLHYGFYLFIGMLISAALSPVEFNHWHLILCLPFSALLVSIGLGKYIEQKNKWHWSLVAILVYFCIYNSFAVMGSKMHNLGNSYHDQVIERFPVE